MKKFLLILSLVVIFILSFPINSKAQCNPYYDYNCRQYQYRPPQGYGYGYYLRNYYWQQQLPPKYYGYWPGVGRYYQYNQGYYPDASRYRGQPYARCANSPHYYNYCR